MQKNKNIVVAPLNWGLGHATRCIPIINALLDNGFNPIVASDGGALQLLRKEFPNLKSITLPSYGITYPKSGKYFTLHLLASLPRILAAVKKEHQMIEKLILEENISGIISDNRFGVRNTQIPSVYITHQLRVLSGVFTLLSTLLHQCVIRKFDACWVPDSANDNGFSGRMGHLKNTRLNLKYVGVLSRFKAKKQIIEYDYLVLLSGPEPQRGILAEKLLCEFKNTTKNVVFVMGNMENKQVVTQIGNVRCYNFMLAEALSDLIHRSAVVIARPGYTTVMDLAILNKKAFFIPTPGQFEQLYLAKRLDMLKLAPFAFQDQFSSSDLEKNVFYQGLCAEQALELTGLFEIFK